MTQSLFWLAPLILSSIFFSNIHTLTSLLVVLCVAPTTFHSPTLNPLEPDEAVEGRWADDEAGDADGVDEWRA